MLVSIGTYDICNGTLAGGVAIGQGRIQLDRGFDVVVPISQINRQPLDRAFRTITFTFTVQRVHSSASIAEAFVMGLDEDLPSSGAVKLTPTYSVDYRFIVNGFVSLHESQLTGATSTTTYTIIGGPPV